MNTTSLPPSITLKYFLRVNVRGEILHENVAIEDSQFIWMLYRNLEVNSSGLHNDFPFLCTSGTEQYFVACDDSPIVFTDIVEGKVVFAQGTHRVEFLPRDLSVGEDGVLYHRAPVGEWGRVLPSLAVQLSKHMTRWGPHYLFDDGTTTSLIIPRNSLVHKTTLLPSPENSCIGCGANNPHSLRLVFLYDRVAKSAVTYLSPDARFNGSTGFVHGGMISLLLDETMGKVLSAQGIKAPTAYLNVSFRNPVPMLEEISVHGWIERTDGRKNFLKGEIRSSSEVVLAKAEALFITVQKKKSST